jgi:hypothetical protein
MLISKKIKENVFFFFLKQEEGKNPPVSSYSYSMNNKFILFLLKREALTKYIPQHVFI